MTALDLEGDVVGLTRTLCDIESVSGDETRLADLVEAALRGYDHLQVLRDGDTVVARTRLGRAERVVIGGHLDTVPLRSPEPNLPTWYTGEDERAAGGADERVLHGRGNVDMKGGVAVHLALAAALTAPNRDVTWFFYDNEEVEAERNGLRRVVAGHPEWLAGDFAVLGEPTAAGIEGGCNGTIRFEVVVPGRAAHSARSWMGVNAIHGAAEVLDRLVAYQPREVEVDGLVYREGMSAVRIDGGVAGNVIPDRCVVMVNHRFAPSTSEAEAEAHCRELFDGFEVNVVDLAGGARPGLHHPAAASFVEAVGREPVAKVGWTDVSRFAAMGIPAVNYGPGDPLLAHRDDEHVPVAQVRQCLEVMTRWLS